MSTDTSKADDESTQSLIDELNNTSAVMLTLLGAHAPDLDTRDYNPSDIETYVLLLLRRASSRSKDLALLLSKNRFDSAVVLGRSILEISCTAYNLMDDTVSESDRRALMATIVEKDTYLEKKQLAAVNVGTISGSLLDYTEFINKTYTWVTRLSGKGRRVPKYGETLDRMFGGVTNLGSYWYGALSRTSHGAYLDVKISRASASGDKSKALVINMVPVVIALRSSSETWLIKYGRGYELPEITGALSSLFRSTLTTNQGSGSNV